MNNKFRNNNNSNKRRVLLVIELNEKVEFINKAIKRSKMPYNKTTIKTYIMNPLVDFTEWCRDNMKLADFKAACNFQYDIYYSFVWSDDIDEFTDRYDMIKKKFTESKK